MKLDFRLAQGLGLTSSRIDTLYDVGKSVVGRLQVAKLLGNIDISYWENIGLLLIDDPSSQVRAQVALSLGTTGREEVISLLDKLVSDPDSKVRYKLALAVLRHGSKEVLPIIKKLLSDPVPEVRAAAFRAFIRFRTLHPEVASNLREIDFLPEKRSTTIFRVLTIEPVVTWYDEKYTMDQDIELATLKSDFDIDLVPLDEESEEKSSDTVSEDATSTRYINSWFEGHPHPLLPLRFQQEYVLGIQVSSKLRVGTFTRGEVKFQEPEFGNQETLDVVVAIVTDDFEVLEKPAKRIKLPKDKRKESSIVTFKVRPIKNNQDVFISVLFYNGNNLFHEALIGAQVQVVEARKGKVPTAYFTPENRFWAPIRGRGDVNLQVIQWEDGYRFVLFYDFGNSDFDIIWCRIPVTPDKVANLIKAVQDDMMNVVHTEDTLADGSTGRIFFDGESTHRPLVEKRLPNLYLIKNKVYMRTLQALSRAGRRLYVDLFNPMKGNEKERKKVVQFGEALRKLSIGRALRIQVLSDTFFIPWNVFYDGDYPADTVDPNEFWGFKHIIEEMPYHAREEESNDIISIDGIPLRVGININCTNIPAALTNPQLALVKKLAPAAKYLQRFTEEDVLTALKEKSEECQLEYFYCHAGREGDIQKDFDQSYLGLTSANKGLTLEDVKLATVGSEFKGNPLFILNACESTKMDGQFYDGFVPKFLTMGACALVGTDCELPSLFGAHFGMELLKAFLGGKSIGEALLALRKEFFNQYKNPLGLIYRIFGNADVHLSTHLT